MLTIKTNRLILRQWQQSDLKPFAALNADPHVMEFFPNPLTQEQSDQLVLKLSEKISHNGWGVWAVSLMDTAEFIGCIGLNTVEFHAHFTPAVEIAWRLAYTHWGKGYATEGAKAALQYGFETLKLPELVAFTTINNLRSRHVMEKIGMHHNPSDDFDHPKVADEHPLKRHVLYRACYLTTPRLILGTAHIQDADKLKRFK